MPSRSASVRNRVPRSERALRIPAAMLLGMIAWVAAGCSSVPEAPVQGKGTLWGSFRLVPPDGYTPPGAGGGSYGDPRLRGVVSVDYQKPGFSVVYLEDRPPPVSGCALTIRETPTGPRIEPSHGALAAGGSIDIVNYSGEKQILSIPELGELRPLDPGARWQRPVDDAGEPAAGGERRAVFNPGGGAERLHAKDDLQIVHHPPQPQRAVGGHRDMVLLIGRSRR